MQTLRVNRGLAIRTAVVVIGFLLGFGWFISDRRDQIAYEDFVIRDHAGVFAILDRGGGGPEPSAANLFDLMDFRSGSVVERSVHVLVGDPPAAERERIVAREVLDPLTSCLRAAVRMMDAWEDAAPVPGARLRMAHAPLIGLMELAQADAALAALPQEAAMAFSEGRKAWTACPAFTAPLRDSMPYLLPTAFAPSDVAAARAAFTELADRLERLRRRDLVLAPIRLAAVQDSAGDLDAALLHVFRPTERRDFLSTVSQNDIARLQAASQKVATTIAAAMQHRVEATAPHGQRLTVGDLFLVYLEAAFIPVMFTLVFGSSLFLSFFLTGAQPGPPSGSS
ncbi:hypothetical protein [Methylobrevis albus]|uniref:Uncharacterized protein n=1 Tax=Methylobrevis albus TaxID=2793297 RepID=A0A931I2E4_9HYPH|nr:hypothetical protein [Methylobrevis albus]MBH0238572.1 hypothetical protein [Methylobrevis albus]